MHAHGRPQAEARNRHRAALLWFGPLAIAWCSLAHAFGFADVQALARAAAGHPYQPQRITLPNAVDQISYEAYNAIHFRPERSIWRDRHLAFELQCFPVGGRFKNPVRIHLIEGNDVRDLAFDPQNFDYGPVHLDPQDLAHLAYSGFRVHFAVNRVDYKDEVLEFQGASYFRALGRGQGYGLSARGLAVDTGLPSGEEFPLFSDFWVHRPQPGEQTLTIDALLDSPRAAGAYRFVLHPGATTAIDVQAQVFLRESVAKLGLAPLTSMYFYGENQRAPREDYRPAVHDSQGLQIAVSSGEWIWRPLVNPRRLLVTSFTVNSPAGFGLMQRDRDFQGYQDLSSRFELRPSAWIQPIGRWGAGHIELVQLPTPDETNDNIVAYWMPAAVPPPGQPLDIAYQIQWQLAHETHPPSAWVTQSRRGPGYERPGDNSVVFTVDFDGPGLRRLPADAPLQAVASADDNGQITQTQLTRNPVTEGWRVELRVKRRDDERPVDLRLYLRKQHDTISETWSYILPPE